MTPHPLKCMKCPAAEITAVLLVEWVCHVGECSLGEVVISMFEGLGTPLADLNMWATP